MTRNSAIDPFAEYDKDNTLNLAELQEHFNKLTTYIRNKSLNQEANNQLIQHMNKFISHMYELESLIGELQSKKSLDSTEVINFLRKSRTINSELDSTIKAIKKIIPEIESEVVIKVSTGSWDIFDEHNKNLQAVTDAYIQNLQSITYKNASTSSKVAFTSYAITIGMANLMVGAAICAVATMCMTPIALVKNKDPRDVAEAYIPSAFNLMNKGLDLLTMVHNNTKELFKSGTINKEVDQSTERAIDSQQRLGTYLKQMVPKDYRSVDI